MASSHSRCITCYNTNVHEYFAESPWSDNARLRSLVGNAAGAAFLAWLSVRAGLLADSDLMLSVGANVAKKLSMPLDHVFFQGVMSAWLICSGLWGAIASGTVSGKVIAIFLGISTVRAPPLPLCLPHDFMSLGCYVVFMYRRGGPPNDRTAAEFYPHLQAKALLTPPLMLSLHLHPCSVSFPLQYVALGLENSVTNFFLFSHAVRRGLCLPV